MKKLLLTFVASLASTAAIAHTSVVPHTHPHDVSILPDLSAMLLAAVIVAGGAFALHKIGRKP